MVQEGQSQGKEGTDGMTHTFPVMSEADGAEFNNVAYGPLAIYFHFRVDLIL